MFAIEKTYSRREVLYIVGLVFLTCVIIGLGTAILLVHPHAVVAADVAGIGISIVLAVVAIVWTMVDSGGQRQTVAKLSETTDQLQLTVSDIGTVMDKTIDASERIEKMSMRLVRMIRDEQRQRDDLSVKVDRLLSNLPMGDTVPDEAAMNRFRQELVSMRTELENAPPATVIRQGKVYVNKKASEEVRKNLVRALAAARKYINELRSKNPSVTDGELEKAAREFLSMAGHQYVGEKTIASIIEDSPQV